MGELGNFTIDQMAGSLALLLGSIGGLCLILFKSRCTQISICWGLWSCNRQVLDEEEGDVKKEDDKKKDESHQKQYFCRKFVHGNILFICLHFKSFLMISLFL